MATTEQIKIVLLKRKITVKDLSERLGTTSQNLSGKFKRDNFSRQEILDIAEALNCDFKSSFVLRDTGETI